MEPHRARLAALLLGALLRRGPKEVQDGALLPASRLALARRRCLRLLTHTEMLSAVASDIYKLNALPWRMSRLGITYHLHR